MLASIQVASGPGCNAVDPWAMHGAAWRMASAHGHPLGDLDAPRTRAWPGGCHHSHGSPSLMRAQQMHLQILIARKAKAADAKAKADREARNKAAAERLVIEKAEADAKSKAARDARAESKAKTSAEAHQGSF
jgi:hypothetical protein